METSADNTPTCPTCGQPRLDGHACSGATAAAPAEGGTGGASSASDETTSIQIPEALRNTGLFRAAWKPESESVPEIDGGSIFTRATDTQAPTYDEPTAPPAAAAEPAPFEPAPADPWAGLDLTVTDQHAPVAVDPWADLTPPAPAADEAPDDATTAPDPLFDEPEATEPLAAEPFAHDPLGLDPLGLDTPAPSAAAEQDPLDADPLGVDPRLTSWDDTPAAEDDEVAAAAHPTEHEAAEVTAADGEPVDQAVDEDGADAGADDTGADDEDAAFTPASFESAEPTVEPLSPIAAAAAAAAAARQEKQAAPGLEETAAFDLDRIFADEAAAHAALEPVPDPEQSAYDLYGDSLYAPADESAPVRDDAPATLGGFPALEQTAAATALTPATEPVFAARLSDAAVTSASLPSSVPFAPGADVPTPVGPDGTPLAAPSSSPKKPRKWVPVIAAVVAVALVAGAGGWWWSMQKDAPVKDAFATSHSAFVSAANQLERAGSVADIAAAGVAFERSVNALNSTAEAARESGSDIATSARRATLAETAVAEAASPLQGISTDDLSPWTSAKEPLREALEELDTIRADVETAGGDPSALPSAEIIDKVQDVIAAEIVNGAGATVIDLGAKLESASLLADVRAVGTSAGEIASALSEAADGVDDPEQKSDLTAVVEFHQALSKFTGVRSSTFDAWADLRKDANRAADELNAGKEEARAGIKAADTLITEARATFEAWESKHAAAKAKKTADAEAISAAVAAVKSADDSYSTLYSQLESVVNQAVGLPSEGTSGEAYRLLDAAAVAREQLVSSLEGFTLVPNSAKRLDTLVAALRSDAEAVRAAAAAAGSCEGSCRLGSAPAIRSLGATTAEAAEAWSEGIGPWETTTTAAAEKIADRKLPKRPKI